MKKLLLPVLLLSGLSAAAQTPINRNQSMVAKATATWCGPCGEWGWTTQEDIIADNMPPGVATPRAFVMTCYGAESTTMYNMASEELTGWATGYPNWGFNNTDRTARSSGGGIYPSVTRSNIQASVDSFYLLPSKAATGFTMNISGGTLTVNTVTKFFEPGNGTYNLAVYMIEDSVLYIQNGQSGQVYHHEVLRGEMNSVTFGQQLATGQIAQGATYNKSFTKALPSGWNTSRMKVFTVIWKQNGANYDYINGNSVPSASAGVAQIEAATQLEVYPVPATTVLNVSGAINGTAGLQLSLINALGQVVKTMPVANVAGQFNQTVDVNGMSAGIYQLVLEGKGARTVRRVAIGQ